MEEMTAMDMSRRPWRTIWTLSWPQLLMMVGNFLIGFVDVWAAGRIGSHVQAAAGMITQALFLFLILAIATANGSVAAISQSMGAGLYRRIQRYVGLCLVLGAGAGLFIAAAGLALREPLLDLFQTPPDIRPAAAYFLEVFLYLLPPYYLLIICNAVFRAQKRVMVPLYAMILVMVLNTVGDLGFGLGWFGLPAYGYKGLAWSTFWSVTAGAAYCLTVMVRHKLLARTSFAPWRWVRAALPYLSKVALPAGLMQAVWQAGYMVLFAVTASLPRDSVTALAGMTAGMRVESMLFLPAFALNLTAAILVGHYLGARQPETAKAFGYRILVAGVAGISLFSLVLWWFIGPVTGFIAPEQAVAAQGVAYLFWNMLAIPFTVTSMILAGALGGAGATLYNMGIMGVSTWFVRLPLAWWLGHRVMESASGVWISMFVSQAVQSVILLYFYQCKDWPRFSMYNHKTKPARTSHAP